MSLEGPVNDNAVFVAIGGCFSFVVSQGVPGIAADNPAIAKILSGSAFPVISFVDFF